MTNKTYNQYCAIAHALDIVGDRWTLIIIRNLLFGPKRFSDLMKGLPSISTNMLTERLKLLEERRVIATRYLPPPAASNVYELTEKGYALTDVLAALARWGSATLGEPQDGQFMVDEGIAFMVMGVFQRRDYPSVSLKVRVQISDAEYQQAFGLQLTADGVVMTENPDQPADVVLQIPLEPLSRLSSGRVMLQALVDDGTVSISGASQASHDLIAWVDGR